MKKMEDEVSGALMWKRGDSQAMREDGASGSEVMSVVVRARALLDLMLQFEW